MLYRPWFFDVQWRLPNSISSTTSFHNSIPKITSKYSTVESSTFLGFGCDKTIGTESSITGKSECCPCVLSDDVLNDFSNEFSVLSDDVLIDFSNEFRDSVTHFLGDFDPKEEGLDNGGKSDFIGAEGAAAAAAADDDDDDDDDDGGGVALSSDRSSPMKRSLVADRCNGGSFTPPIDNDVVFTSLVGDAVDNEASVRVDDATEFDAGDFPSIFECFGHKTCPVARSQVVAKFEQPTYSHEDPTFNFCRASLAFNLDFTDSDSVIFSIISWLAAKQFMSTALWKNSSKLLRL